MLSLTVSLQVPVSTPARLTFRTQQAEGEDQARPDLTGRDVEGRNVLISASGIQRGDYHANLSIQRPTVSGIGPSVRPGGARQNNE